MRRWLVLFVLVSLALPACSARPGLDLAAGWRSTDSMTGPAVSVGAGEWQAAEPFDGASLDAAPCVGGSCRVAPPAPSPELAGKLAELEAAAVKSREALEQLDARVAAGALSPAQAEAMREAAAAAERAETRARGAIAEATAAAAKADEAKRRAESPPPVPTDWTPPGLVAGALALAGWWIQRRNARDAKAAADALRRDAETRARELAAQAVDAYDRAPYTAADANAIKAAGEGKLGLVT